MGPNPERRSERSRRAILQATLELCREVGYDQMTIEAIARRAGVGKQTIYRWWPSKGVVAFDAIEASIGRALDFPDTGDVVTDLRKQMTGLAGLLADEAFAAPYAGLISAARSEPDLGRRLLELVGVRVDAARARLEQAQAQGQLRADVDVDDVIELLYGPLYYRLLLRTRPVTADQVPRILDLAFAGLRPGVTRRRPWPRVTGRPD